MKTVYITMSRSKKDDYPFLEEVFTNESDAQYYIDKMNDLDKNYIYYIQRRVLRETLKKETEK